MISEVVVEWGIHPSTEMETVCLVGPELAEPGSQDEQLDLISATRVITHP